MSTTNKPFPIILRRLSRKTKKLVEMQAMFTRSEIHHLVSWSNAGRGDVDEFLPNQPQEVRDFLKNTVSLLS